MREPSRFRLAACLALGLACLAGSVRAEPAWDAARVTHLAGELHAAIGEGLALARRAPPQESAFQQRTRDAAVTKMERANEIAGEYAERLRGGWSREDSESFFRQLRAIISDARKTAGDAVPEPEITRVLERVDELLGEIGGYYSGA